MGTHDSGYGAPEPLVDPVVIVLRVPSLKNSHGTEVDRHWKGEKSQMIER